MSQKTDSEKIKTCFQALGINDNKAYEILFAELARLGNDERIPEQKQITVRVLNDGQKLIAETLMLLIEKQLIGRGKSPSQLGCVKVEYEDISAQSSKPENVIDLGNFDYNSERDKLVSRCNATIIGNRDIGDVIWEQEKAAEKQPYDSEMIEELTTLNQNLQSLNNRIKSYENRFFVMFRETKLENAYDEKEFLAEQLEEIEKRYEKEKSYRQYASNRRRTRLSGIVKKEDILQGIKYLFTGRREELVKTVDENGRTVRTFVVKPQEDSPYQRENTSRGVGRTSGDVDSPKPKLTEYDGIDK